MSGLEWFFAVFSLGLMAISFWVRMMEDRAVAIKVRHRSQQQRVYIRNSYR